MSGMVQFFVLWLTGFLAGALLGWHLGTRRTPAAVPATAGDGAAHPGSPAVHGPGLPRHDAAAPGLGEKPGLRRTA